MTTTDDIDERLRQAWPRASHEEREELIADYLVASLQTAFAEARATRAAEKEGADNDQR